MGVLLAIFVVLAIYLVVNKMGVLLAIFVVLAIYLVVKIYQDVPIKKICHQDVPIETSCYMWEEIRQGDDQDNIPFSTKHATASTYSSFIEALRARLTNEAPRICGIPVLPQSSSVPDSTRFVLVDLFNKAGKTVTVAIDVVNVYVMAFRVHDQVYFFNDSPKAAIETSFTKTVKPHSSKKKSVKFQLLNCSSNYSHIVNYGKKNKLRTDTNLGITALDDAIFGLCANVDAALGSSLLVIIQMVSEAVRFRYIETQVRESIIRRNSSLPDTFLPDPYMLSLMENWSSLSTAIQSPHNGQLFEQPVILKCPRKEDVTVANIQSPVIFDLALLLYSCPAGPQNQGQHRVKPRKPSVLGNKKNSFRVRL